MLGYKYLEALPAVAAGDANKLLLLPTGASDAMGAVAGLGAAFARAPPAPKPSRPPRGAAAAPEPRGRQRPVRARGRLMPAHATLTTPLVESGRP